MLFKDSVNVRKTCISPKVVSIYQYGLSPAGRWIYCLSYEDQSTELLTGAQIGTQFKPEDVRILLPKKML